MARGSPQQDESAPLFFLLALLACIVVPWGLSVLWALLFPGKKEVEQAFPSATEDGLRVRHCQTQAMVAKRDAQVKVLRSRARMCTKGFLFRTAILVVLALWLVYIAVQVQKVLATSALYQNFDPYDILGVGRSSGTSDVKKAYRKLAMKYHPDKNQEPGAPEMFIRVKKAFDALTDPVAKRNYAKYGNPDGPVHMELSVALPTVSKENQGLVLILFVLLFIIGVPVTALCCMGGDSDTVNGVLRETMESLAQSVSESADVRAAQELLLTSCESARAAIRQEDAEALEAAAKALQLSGRKGKAEVNRVAEVLLQAHLQRRTDLLSAPMAAELESLLPKWRAVALAIAEIGAKKGSPQAALAGVELHRCLVQALEPGASSAGAGSLLQVPHMNAERAKNWRKGPRKAAALPGFLELSTEERKASLDGLGLSAQELADVDEFAAAAPRLSVAQAKVFVEGEDGICQGDIATLQLKLRRANLQEGEATGSAHTPLFPSAAVREAWWLLCAFPGRGGGAFRKVRLDGPGRDVVAEVKFKVPAMNKCRITFQLICEAYAGLDIEQQVNFEAVKASEIKPPSDDEEDDGDDDAEDEE